MRKTGDSSVMDESLLRKFEDSVKKKVPHLEQRLGGKEVVNPTPLVEITDMVRECARVEYGLELSDKEFAVFGKFESEILGGSVKVRPMVQIIEDAIRTGRLSSGQTVFEATSGNFGVALGLSADIGLNVIALVSRRLQEGVFEELMAHGVRTVDLDVDICPAPGMKVDLDTLTAKAVFSNMRGQLSEYGFDSGVLDRSRTRVEELLARQDVINLAKILAEIYNGFCPEQYDNELNVAAHEMITGPEIDSQLSSMGHSLGDSKVICTFGTGGTSGGLSRYIQRKYGKRSVHVVFPMNNQDVAGIRTKEKASGLRFYEQERYAGEHEADFEQARRLLRFFVGRGHDIGESSALALYSVMQMVNFGISGSFVVILADGAQKYKKSLGAAKRRRSFETSLEEVTSNIGNYSGIIWTHAMFTPREEGVELIAGALGVDKAKVRVARASDIDGLISSGEMSAGLDQLVRESGKRPLLVCLAGVTSLRVAQLLAEKEVEAVSLTGGITKLSETRHRPLPQLVQLARE